MYVYSNGRGTRPPLKQRYSIFVAIAVPAGAGTPGYESQRRLPLPGFPPRGTGHAFERGNYEVGGRRGESAGSEHVDR